MSSIKINAQFIWTKKVGDYPYYKTENNRFFTYVSWMGITPENSNVKMFIAKCSNKHHSEKFRYEIYEVNKQDIKEQNYDRWKWLEKSRDIVVEITNPEYHRPKLIKIEK